MSPFSFLRLPREIRDQILGYLLVYPMVRTSGTKGLYSRFESVGCESGRFVYALRYPVMDKFPAIDPAVLSVNKQLRDEGYPILYGRNVFIFLVAFSGSRVLSFLEDLQPSTRKLLRHVHIDGYDAVEFQPLNQIIHKKSLYEKCSGWLSFCVYCEKNLRLQTLAIDSCLRSSDLKALPRWKHALSLLTATGCTQELYILDPIKPLWSRPTLLRDLQAEMEVSWRAKIVRHAWYRYHRKRSSKALVISFEQRAAPAQEDRGDNLRSSEVSAPLP
ncbi:hypothetical protein MMC24_005426 [Lignoscripta atroalba]|nr:hypothetical protein [Lignoscripta atroalba]